MDTVTAVVEILKACAWPAAAIVICLIFRKPFARVIGLIESVKYKDLEVRISRELANTQKLISADKKEAVASGERDTSSLLDLAAVSPRAAIIETWTLLEGAGAKAEALATKGATRLRKVKSLRFEDVLAAHHAIGADIAEAIARLRNIRNQVAHASEYQPTTEDAEEFVLLAFAVIVDLENAGKA